jgi:dihydroxy-acid dehydratase
MPEVGSIPIPAKLRRQGVTDMLRISDARMSGTSTGSIVLHVTPEAAAGGPLGRLQTGDDVEIDVERGLINHFVGEQEFNARTAYTNTNAPGRGFSWLHQQHVLQADAGCDFDFLRSIGVNR